MGEEGHGGGCICCVWSGAGSGDVVVLVNNERMAVVPVVGVVNIQKAVMKYKHTYSLHLPDVHPLCRDALLQSSITQ